MNDITKGMHDITEELRTLQQKLQQALLEGTGGQESLGAPDDRVTLEQVRDFKATLDQMRHFLWFFMQAASEDDAGEKLIELLRQAARVCDGDELRTFEQMNASSEYAILHATVPPNRKPN